VPEPGRVRRSENEFTFGCPDSPFSYDPCDECGGSSMITLQLMLSRCDGKRIWWLPAWPADWTADFKLHAPHQTTVEGRGEAGKSLKLKVTPALRAKDAAVGPVGRP
jgi:alpha-L-fucosidase 2